MLTKRRNGRDYNSDPAARFQATEEPRVGCGQRARGRAMSFAIPAVLDLSRPLQLTAALIPDLVLVVGAMILVVVAAWRPDSRSHQRAVGWASIVVTLLSLAAVVYFLLGGYGAGPGPIAVDNYRWMVDVVILLGTVLTLMLAMDDNDRELITAPETHVPCALLKGRRPDCLACS